MIRFDRPLGLLGVALMVCSLGTLAAAAGWVAEQSTGPFVVHSEFPLDDYTEALEGLRELQGDLIKTLEVRPAQEKIEVYLFREQSTYQRYLKHYFPQVGYRRAIYIKARGPGMVLAYLHKNFVIDLRHECTHALLHASLPVVPLWLDEGLAEYFQMPSHRRSTGNPHLAALKWNLRLGMVSGVTSLEKRQSLDEMGRQDYRFAWAWTHFMLHGPPEARQQLVGFLQDIDAGVPAGVLSQRLMRQIPNIESRLVDHFRSVRR